MVSTQKHAFSQIGSSAVAVPFVDVVGFAPGGGPVAIGPQASAVAGGQSDPLPAGEESLFAADVDALPVGIEGDREDAGIADVPLDGFDGDRVTLPVNPTMPGAFVEGVFGDQDPYGGTPGTDHRGRGDGTGDLEELQESVVGELFEGAGIIGTDRLGPSLLGGIDHARSTTPG